MHSALLLLFYEEHGMAYLDHHVQMNEPCYDGECRRGGLLLLLNMVDVDDDNVMFFKRETCPAWMIFPVQNNIRMDNTRRRPSCCCLKRAAREKFINN